MSDRDPAVALRTSNWVNAKGTRLALKDGVEGVAGFSKAPAIECIVSRASVGVRGIDGSALSEDDGSAS